MGSINKSHNDADGGILLFSGELILLYCDSVSCEVGGKESFKGRVYLTTHRLVVIMTPFRQNAPVKSFCAPFCAITKCGVEQPIFGANYIEATVRDEVDPSKSFSFKLKFSKGGAIELAMAMNRAVQAVGRNWNPSMAPPPAYTPSPSAQYYQAPPTVYAPGYNSGVQMPVQQFPDQPPIGFIYASDAPPPYPGLAGNGGQQGPQSGYQNPQQPPQGGAYPPQSSVDYPGQQTSPQHQPSTGYPGQQPPQHQWGGYPAQQPTGQQQQQQQPWAGYPVQQGPAQAQQSSGGGYPDSGSTQQQASSAGYPDLSGGGYPPVTSQQQNPQQFQVANQGQSWPSAPSFNPNWQEDQKKT